MSLAGTRALVVGASSGIGRAIALRLCAEGARTVLAARRLERLEQAAAEAKGEALAIACDVRDADSCQAVADRAASRLGGLDALVYATGIVPVGGIEEADAAEWRRVLETNVIGAALVTRAALPHLREARGRAVYLSSIAARERPPRPGTALYLISKTALDAQVRCWEREHRAVRFTRISVGDTVSEAGSDWDPEVAARYLPRWGTEGFLLGRVMEPESVAEQVAHVLSSAEAVPELRIQPHYPQD